MTRGLKMSKAAASSAFFITTMNPAAKLLRAAPSINWMNPVYTGAPSSVPLYASSLTDQKTKAIYLQQDLTFFDRLTVSAGLRNDWIDTEQTNRLNGTTASGDISELTKRIGVSYKVTNEIAPYISYAESVKAGIGPHR